MKFKNLNIVPTDDCNFNCSYCYQDREENVLTIKTLSKFIEFFYPFLEDKAHIAFYGGEPLLQYELINYTVGSFEKLNNKEKNIQYHLTTNGSLITHEMLKFFDENKFHLMISFDGLGQDKCRKNGSFITLEKIIKYIVKSNFQGLRFSTNSVFSPECVNQLCESIEYLIGLNIPNIHFSLAEDIYWSKEAITNLEAQLEILLSFLKIYYRKHKKIPLAGFNGNHKKDKKAIFQCNGVSERMALTPDGKLWGCYQFYYYCKKHSGKEQSYFCLGSLEDFITRYESYYDAAKDNYLKLNQSQYYTDTQYCFLCDDLHECSICLPYVCRRGANFGEIPDWVCQLKKKFRAFRKNVINECEVN